MADRGVIAEAVSFTSDEAAADVVAFDRDIERVTVTNRAAAGGGAVWVTVGGTGAGDDPAVPTVAGAGARPVLGATSRTFVVESGSPARVRLIGPQGVGNGVPVTVERTL